MKTKRPILILGDHKSFGLYTEEILKTEGYNAYDISDVANTQITKDLLQRYEVVILGKCTLDFRQVEAIKNYVQEGGKLIGFSPIKALDSIFGVASTDKGLREGYIKIDTEHGFGAGLLPDTMQYHGIAQQYKLKGGEQIAELYKDSLTGTGYPAMVYNRYGSGQAIVFAYNLSESIVLTRQGNWDYAGIEKDGIHGLRPMDLFTDGWVNPSKNNLNQADEQMRLFSGCIVGLLSDTMPLPRVWYFPGGLKCLAILTNDGEDRNEDEFAVQFDEIEAKGAKMTLYIKELDLVSSKKAQEWIDRGHEISGHPDDTLEAAHPTWENMSRKQKEKREQIFKKYGQEMKTVANHWFVWCGETQNEKVDFTAQAKIESQSGIKMDMNYVDYDNNSSQGCFLGVTGNYTGSGLSMKFCDSEGRTLDIYQTLTNVYDQKYMEADDKGGFFKRFKDLMDQSINDDVFSVIGVKAHNDEWYWSKEPILKMLDYAKEKKIPVWTAKNLLEFIEAKDGIRFDNLVWQENTLRFELSAKHELKDVTLLLPKFYGGKELCTIKATGVEKNFDYMKIKGNEVVCLVLGDGAQTNYEVSYR